MPKKSRRHKHVPQRTCVGCRKVLPKRSLIRIVRGPQGVQIDPTGKISGRGAYLHDRQSCWERGINGALAVALKTDINAVEKAELALFMATLPEEIADDQQEGH